MVNLGKYTSPMDGMGHISQIFVCIFGCQINSFKEVDNKKDEFWGYLV